MDREMKFSICWGIILLFEPTSYRTYNYNSHRQPYYRFLSACKSQFPIAIPPILTPSDVQPTYSIVVTIESYLNLTNNISSKNAQKHTDIGQINLSYRTLLRFGIIRSKNKKSICDNPNSSLRSHTQQLCDMKHQSNIPLIYARSLKLVIRTNAKTKE